MDIPIIILAAGASSRMGTEDKLLQQVDGMPLLARQAHMARSVTDAEVIIALPPRPHPRYDALTGLNATPCSVPDPSEGMNASLRQAVAHLPSDAHAFMLLLGDLPDLTADDLRKVLDAVDVSQGDLVWRGTTESGAPGHPVVFHRALFPALERLTGDTGGKEVMEEAHGRIVLVPLPGTRARHDLDTPADWAEWREHNPHRV